MSFSELWAKVICRSSLREAAFIDHDKVIDWPVFFSDVDRSRTELSEHGVRWDDVVVLEGDFTYQNVVALFALALIGCITIPITATSLTQEEIITVTGATKWIRFTDGLQVGTLQGGAKPPLLNRFQQHQSPGLIFLSSGSTGKPKAILHSLDRLTSKYTVHGKAKRTLAFLLFDHIAGIDTLLYTFFAGGELVFNPDRSPASILSCLEKHRIQVFPTSPSYLKYLMFSEDLRCYNLSSLEIITFGSERMPKETLDMLQHSFGGKVKLIQKYGATEFGSPMTTSNPDDPLFIQFRQTENFQSKIVNNRLFIKSNSSMIGYLNVSDMIMEDGWIDTGDDVEVRGEWVKILGRSSEMINVGGQKVYPAEVEEVLESIDNIESAVVYGATNPMMGQVVAARISLTQPEDIVSLKKRIRIESRNKLESYKIPSIIELSESPNLNSRFKKNRT